jgi:hypothetical protein
MRSGWAAIVCCLMATDIPMAQLHQGKTRYTGFKSHAATITTYSDEVNRFWRPLAVRVASASPPDTR